MDEAHEAFGWDMIYTKSISLYWKRDFMPKQSNNKVTFDLPAPIFANTLDSFPATIKR